MAKSLACQHGDRVGDRWSHNRHTGFVDPGRLVVGGNHLHVPIGGATDIRVTRYLWKFVCCAMPLLKVICSTRAAPSSNVIALSICATMFWGCRARPASTAGPDDMDRGRPRAGRG